mmetsp:Transcript_18303/g.27592  ORF Transcript_18303/g.27592 Transcript_18303/m.27592 type:complete len:596 (+) Transcript_18303:178-1965(+)
MKQMERIKVTNECRRKREEWYCLNGVEEIDEFCEKWLEFGGAPVPRSVIESRYTQEQYQDGWLDHIAAWNEAQKRMLTSGIQLALIFEPHVEMKEHEILQLVLTRPKIKIPTCWLLHRREKRSTTDDWIENIGLSSGFLCAYVINFEACSLLCKVGKRFPFIYPEDLINILSGSAMQHLHRRLYQNIQNVINEEDSLHLLASSHSFNLSITTKKKFIPPLELFCFDLNAWLVLRCVCRHYHKYLGNSVRWRKLSLRRTRQRPKCEDEVPTIIGQLFSYLEKKSFLHFFPIWAQIEFRRINYTYISTKKQFEIQLPTLPLLPLNFQIQVCTRLPNAKIVAALETPFLFNCSTAFQYYHPLREERAYRIFVDGDSRNYAMRLIDFRIYCALSATEKDPIIIYDPVLPPELHVQAPSFLTDLIPPCKEAHRPYMLGSNEPYSKILGGPAFSGTRWQRDPCHLSSWHALIAGTRFWIFFKPDPGHLQATPPDHTASPQQWLLDWAYLLQDPDASSAYFHGTFSWACQPINVVVLLPPGTLHMTLFSDETFNLAYSTLLLNKYAPRSRLNAALNSLCHEQLSDTVLFEIRRHCAVSNIID